MRKDAEKQIANRKPVLSKVEVYGAGLRCTLLHFDRLSVTPSTFRWNWSRWSAAVVMVHSVKRLLICVGGLTSWVTAWFSWSEEWYSWYGTWLAYLLVLFAWPWVVCARVGETYTCVAALISWGRAASDWPWALISWPREAFDWVIGTFDWPKATFD